MSDYGDDESVADSVASLFVEEREEEEKIKREQSEETTEEFEKDKDIIKNKLDVYVRFKYSVVQDASNDKLYKIVLKKKKKHHK